MTEDDIVQLQKEYKELKDKYQKVKKYYFEKESQVHTLQNTLAHQRLSLSRTSLDDNEYCNRFIRLDGLISQLAYSIRKSWKTIPHWLAPAVNKDAISVGKQEMTAVGRAFISAWLVSDLFDKYFHPDLEPGLSSQLKAIQLAIRRSGAASAQLSGAEEEEQLTARIVNWRLTTIEGLADQLRAAQAQQNRQQLVANLHEKMKAALEMHLVDPAPPDLDGGVHMIAELAVNVAIHVPLESRDVHIEYFPPGHGILADVMKLESTQIQPLSNPIGQAEGIEADRASLQSTGSALGEEKVAGSAQSSMLDAEGVSSGAAAGVSGAAASNPGAAAGGAKEREGRGARGLLSSFMGGKQKGPAAGAPAGVGAGGSQTSLVQQQQQQQQPGATGPPKEDTPPRVRMAVGVAVQIRGRSVLVKAPVFST
ncbi:hypothetical protein W97_01503 [Coniosporium apollinis CBS 100218]|uniref:Uncharacterized protein n=1 Tax=Coniosporium apollinis (strain CBS 100218) TaxID=1168221 RepID=R7YK28_CONA1|nr:uncharacterized protein W97_01503 [Coniosporium apollinis CBS 100218]EON62282.1 hypothetical protein W97_01503 [Coniosporium apollinis CBS 100218]